MPGSPANTRPPTEQVLEDYFLKFSFDDDTLELYVTEKIKYFDAC